jgi:hypothetical protein
MECPLARKNMSSLCQFDSNEAFFVWQAPECKQGAQSYVMGHKAFGRWACVRYVFCWMKSIHLHYFCNAVWFKLNWNVNREHNSYQAYVKKCTKNTCQCFNYNSKMKSKFKEKSRSFKQEFTTHKTMPYIKNLIKLILSQQASGYVRTPESFKQYIPNTSYSNFRKTTNKINHIEIIM